MKELSEPEKPFNLSTRSFKEVKNIISKIKCSGSSSPIDQISAIALKKVSYSANTNLENHMLLLE